MGPRAGVSCGAFRPHFRPFGAQMNILVLGAGLQGCAAAYDLLQVPSVTRVTLADLNPARLPKFLQKDWGSRLKPLTLEGIRRLDKADRVKIFVGGLPQKPEPPLNYQIVYSLEGALDYYTTPSLVLRGGKKLEVDALSELEDVQFPTPIGTLEAFHTAGGISTLPMTWEGKVDVMEYKTLRYPGHVAIIRPIRELGLLDNQAIAVRGQMVVPRDAFIAAVTPKLLKPEGRDLVALRVEVSGIKDGKPKKTAWQLIDRYDEATGITALMQADGRVTAKGVVTPDESMPAKGYIDELAKRGVKIEEV